MLSPFAARVLATERKKLQAVQEKLPVAIEQRKLAEVVGLAQAAERIAARLVILMDQENKA